MSPPTHALRLRVLQGRLFGARMRSSTAADNVTTSRQAVFSAANWLERSVPGYCAPTQASDWHRACTTEQSGSRQLGAKYVSGGWLTAVEDCLSACLSCSNCRYISISPKYNDCSWFQSCDISRLQHSVSTFRTAAAVPSQALRQVEQRPVSWNGLGSRISRHMSTEHDALDLLQGSRRHSGHEVVHVSEPTLQPQTIPYPTPAHKSKSPVLLLGIISGYAERRALLRCTWVRALTHSVRLRFVVGHGQPDEHSDDVLRVPVSEHQPLSSRQPRLFNGPSTYTQYVKVVAFLRYAALQPERLVAKGDDDSYVQPQLLVAYAHLLLRHQRRGAKTGARPAQDVFAGTFEWYSWKPHTVENVNWGQTRPAASYASGAKDFTRRHCAEYWCNCSSSGGGWGWDGFDISEGAAKEAAAANRSCVGPYAFAKGALTFLSTSAIKWLVKSRRFRQDTQRAAQYFATPANRSDRPRSVAAGLAARTLRQKLSEDAQMGYWLAAHPTLHYVSLPKWGPWVEWRHIGGHFDMVLLVHKMPFAFADWIARNSEESWAKAQSLLVHFNCSDAPPCDPLTCAHRPEQRACHMSARLPPHERGLSIRCADSPKGAGGCSKVCARGDERIGHTTSSVSGRCNFLRTRPAPPPDIISHACKGKPAAVGMIAAQKPLLRDGSARKAALSSVAMTSQHDMQLRGSPARVVGSTPAQERCIATDARMKGVSSRLENHSAHTQARGGSGRLRVAIATLISANQENPCGNGARPYGCGLLPWCVSAKRLRDALLPHFAAVEVIGVHASRRLNERNEKPRARRESVVMPSMEGRLRKDCRFSADTELLDLADCPGMRIIEPTARMINASRQHAARVVASGVMSYYPAYIWRGYVFLWKWELWRLGHEFDAVLHSDLDINLLPAPHLAPKIALEWARKLPPMVKRASPGAGGAQGERMHMVGYADASTPWNGGLFWVFPPRSDALYLEGLDVLEAPWDPSLGWERAGPPSQRFGRGTREPPVRLADGTDSPDHQKLLASIKSWTQVDSGDLDQGMLLYMMHYRHRFGGYMNEADSLHSPAHYVRNKWKPWVRALNYAPLSPETVCTAENLVRQSFLRTATLHGGESACATAFGAAEAELDGLLNRTACCMSMSVPPPGTLRAAFAASKSLSKRQQYGAHEGSLFGYAVLQLF